MGMNFEFGLPDQRVRKQEVYPVITLEYDGEHNHNRNIIINKLAGKLLGFENGEHNHVGISINNESGKPAIVCLNAHIKNPKIAEHAIKVSKTKPWRLSDARYYRALCKYYGLEEVGTHEFKAIHIEGTPGVNLELISSTGEVNPPQQSPAEVNQEVERMEQAASVFAQNVEEAENEAAAEIAPDENQDTETVQEEGRTTPEVEETPEEAANEEDADTPADAEPVEADVAEAPQTENPQAEDDDVTF